MRTLIKNGHLIDPANKKSGKFDLLINKGKIEAVEPKGKLKDITDLKIIDAQGAIAVSYTHLTLPTKA